MATHGIHDNLLEVTVVACNKLKDTEWISRQDPYVCLEYGSNRSRTRTCTDGGKNPKFQEKFVFTLIEGLRELSVNVWNSNTITHDDFIGSGKVKLTKALSQGFDDSTWPLQSKTDRYVGDVRLIMRYHDANKLAPHPSVPYLPDPAFPPQMYGSYYPDYGKRRGNCIDSSNEPIRKRKINDVPIGLEEISKHFGKTMDEAAHSLCVSRSTLKRVCRSLGIHRWTSNATKISRDPTTLTEHGGHAKPKKTIRHAQWPLTSATMEEVCDNIIMNTVIVNVKFKESTEQFTFLLFDGLSNLKHEVAKRFKLEGRNIRLKYVDEDSDLILIGCDDDFMFALDDSSRRMNLICLLD